MPTTEEYRRKIQKPGKTDLIELWNQIEKKDTPEWKSGKALEFLILRAFECEGAIVKWPYEVKIYDETIEQIDGVIHFTDMSLSVMVECKDEKENVNVEPIAKLRNQLLRRPSHVIGSVFVTSSFTAPALTLSRFLSPQTILLREGNHIKYCLLNSYFKEGLLMKYHYAIEHGDPDFDITIQTI